MADNADLFAFGAGDFFMLPQTGGDLTPVKFNLQDFELDIKFEAKALHGRNSFPLTVARGKGSIAVKLKSATVNGAAYNRAFFGDMAQVSTAGQLTTAVNEVLMFAVGAVTAACANAAKFRLDLGLIRVDTAQPLTKLNAAPAAPATPAPGTYYVDNAGNYQFNVADGAGGLVCSYTWMAATGVTTTINNTSMGSSPNCKGIFTTNFQGRQATVQLNQVMSTDLKLATKLDDFLIPEQSLQAFADLANVVGMISLGA